MCSGRGAPGISTTFSGKSGMSVRLVLLLVSLNPILSQPSPDRSRYHVVRDGTLALTVRPSRPAQGRRKERHDEHSNRQERHHHRSTLRYRRGHGPPSGKKGCNVVLAARREDRLERLVSELGDEQTLATPTDVTDSSACAALVDRTLDHFGSLDVLVNNAGLGLYASFTEADPEDWRTMFDVNVLGVLYATQAAVRGMSRQGSGHVGFISSLAARRVPSPEATVYAATKHAITAVVEGLRMELLGERDIRVTSVEPALVRTEFPESTHPSAEEFYAGKGYTPLEAEDVASAVLYAIEQPERVSVDEILVRSTEQLN